MAYTIKVNGTAHTSIVDGDIPLLWVVARRARHDRHEVRLRHGTVRRLHRARRRPSPPFLHHPCRQHRHFRDHHDRGNRRDSGGAKIQEAGLDREVVQCGYCQSGQIMSASAAGCEQPTSNRFRYRRRDVRQHLPRRDLCPHSRRRSSRPRNRTAGRLTMILDHITSRIAGGGRSPSANGLSRRRFLQAGAAAAGGLSLPFRKRRCRSGRRRCLRAQWLHPH